MAYIDLKIQGFFYAPWYTTQYVCIFEFCVDLISQDQECFNDHFEEIFVAN